MSYCRMQNTLKDLRDCDENFYEVSSASEKKARLALYHLCKEIADNNDLEELENDLEDED